ncbi:ABC transporter permease [bacterium]|nr:ABC transporter permease [bacterium]
MLQNYLKIALRNLWKSKSYSIINISGLSVGMAACCLIGLYIFHEWSFDRHHEKADRIYRVALNRVYPTNEVHWASVGPGVGIGLKESLPEIESAVRMTKLTATFQRNNQQFVEERVVETESSIFNVFSIPAIAGSTSLSDPSSIILSQSMAKKYFGETDPLGQTLTIVRIGDKKVTGIVADCPSTSHFKYDCFITFNPQADLTKWDVNFGFYTYLLLREGTDIKSLEGKIAKVTDTYLSRGPGAEKYSEWLAAGNAYKYYLQPLTDIHLHSNLKWEFETNGDFIYAVLFAVVGVFILLIAAVNFVNLSTARSMHRAKEIGVRKASGSSRQQLIIQFLLESVLTCLIAATAAFGLTEVLIQPIGNLIGSHLSAEPLFQPNNIVLIFIGVIFLGILSGSYPAFYLSGFKPISILKGQFNVGHRSRFRNGLVVFQFMLSVLLIVGTMIVYQQIQFMMNKKLGFNKNNVLVIRNARSLGDQLKTFKQETGALASVESISIMGQTPGRMTGAATYRGAGQPNPINMTVMGGDHQVLSTLGIEMAAGRSYNESDYADTARYVIINEKAANMLGWADHAVGQQLFHEGTSNAMTVIGVVKDFHMESLQKEIRPVVYFLDRNWQGSICVRVRSENIAATVKNIESIWKYLAPSSVFQHTFLDEDYAALYRAETTTVQIFLWLTGLAIMIACLGLFGLSAFITERRTKEIGIRKVVGATAFNIVSLLSGDFIKPVLLANLLAAPVAYWVMNGWLENFAYRTTIGWDVFVIAAIGAVLIAVMTVSLQSMKAASSNPVNALKYE